MVEKAPRETQTPDHDPRPAQSRPEDGLGHAADGQTGGSGRRNPAMAATVPGAVRGRGRMTDEERAALYAKIDAAESQLSEHLAELGAYLGIDHALVRSIRDVLADKGGRKPH